MNELIYEFFYDGIGRIIPGAVVMGFYFREQIEEKFWQHTEHSLTALTVFSQRPT